jgi:hypothetical protein
MQHMKKNTLEGSERHQNEGEGQWAHTQGAHPRGQGAHSPLVANQVKSPRL